MHRKPRDQHVCMITTSLVILWSGQYMWCIQKYPTPFLYELSLCVIQDSLWAAKYQTINLHGALHFVAAKSLEIWDT